MNTESPSPDFFSLPRALREDIYRKVLAVPHPLYMFQDSPSHKVESFAPDRPRRWLALLYANRRLHEEAVPLLYSSNHFTFMDTTRQQADLLHGFLDRIGPACADQLSHITINFPVVDKLSGPSSEYQIQDDDLRSLQLLQDRCTRLKTLETIVQTHNSDGLSKATPETLSLINAQFKAISSLDKVVVKVYTKPPKADVMELIRELGWVLLRGP